MAMTVVMDNRVTIMDIPSNHTPDINNNKMIPNNHIHSSSIPRNFKDVNQDIRQLKKYLELKN